MDIEKHVVHEDLEEQFQISAKVEFDFGENEFEGLKPFETPQIKKKQEKKTIIENVNLRESKSKSGLF